MSQAALTEVPIANSDFPMCNTLKKPCCGVAEPFQHMDTEVQQEFSLLWCIHSDFLSVGVQCFVGFIFFVLWPFFF